MHFLFILDGVYCKLQLIATSEIILITKKEAECHQQNKYFGAEWL